MNEQTKNRALRMLDRRDYSRAELTKKLVEKGETAENAEAIRSVQSTMLTQQKEISDQQKAIADQQKKILEHDDILADALVCTC